jgi:hypothetical protein
VLDAAEKALDQVRDGEQKSEDDAGEAELEAEVR